MANYDYGPRGLDLMQGGQTAGQALEALVSDDEDRDDRQVGVVDGRGGTATFTGAGCFDWAGGLTGEYYAAQGNKMALSSMLSARTFAPRTSRSASSSAAISTAQSSIT
jgi:uncharacterized Ntn-hydrolase superfamily protein